MKVLAKR